MDKPQVAETADERRRRHLNDLIELEGGPKRTAGKKPGHYVIAERVYEHENNTNESTQMAQALRQVSLGTRNLGHMTARRIEGAYEAKGLYGIARGWFDRPTGSGASSAAAPKHGSQADEDEEDEALKGIRDLLVGLAMALPSKYTLFLDQSMDLAFSAVPSYFVYRSSNLAILPVIWANPPAIEDDRYYTPQYPLTVYRAIVRLAAWRVKGAKEGMRPRCVVGVVGGVNMPRASPIEVYTQASAIGVDVAHFRSAEHMAEVIQNWDKNPN